MSKEMMGHFHAAHKKSRPGHSVPMKVHAPPPHKPAPEVTAKGGPISTVGNKFAAPPLPSQSLPPYFVPPKAKK